MTHLLCVSGTFQPCKVAVGVNGPQKDGLELVHSSIGKQQGGVIVGNHTARWHLCVTFCLEELNERRTYSVTYTAIALSSAETPSACYRCHETLSKPWHVVGHDIQNVTIS